MFFFCVTEGLIARGVSVWVDEVGLKAGVDFLSKIGQAIIDSKVSARVPSKQERKKCLYQRGCMVHCPLSGAKPDIFLELSPT